jgi:predicted kinase
VGALREWAETWPGHREAVILKGSPGVGKTTLAHAVAPRIGAVVIDHDVTKSALLAADVPVSMAGAASYRVLQATAQHLLQQGHSVIFDSPCFYVELLERGQRLAREAGAAYRYIECRVKDLDELDRRLRTRPRLPSQLAGVRNVPTAGSGKTRTGADVFRHWIANMKRPNDGYLVVDTTRSLQECIDAALSYIRSSHGAVV